MHQRLKREKKKGGESFVGREKGKDKREESEGIKKGRAGTVENGGEVQGMDGKQDVMEVVLCQSYPLIHTETDAFDHSKSQAQSINT